MRVIIAGSRKYGNYRELSEVCDKYIPKGEPIEIVSGHCIGTDMLGERYARERHYPLKIFPADWEKYGKAAGVIRNGQMAEYADMLIAFPVGRSRGTENMIAQAEKKRLEVHVIETTEGKNH